MTLILILAFFRAGFENSRSNTKVFIYNSDTVYTTNQNSIFISLFSDINSIQLYLGKKYFNVQYNYEKGIFESYGNILKDSSTNYTDLTFLLRTPDRMLDVFFSKEGEYDTITQGGRFIGITYHFNWPENAIQFQHTIKYGFDAKKPESSFNLSVMSGKLSLFILGAFTHKETVLATKASYTHAIYKNLKFEQDIEFLYNNLRVQPLFGAKGIMIGPFLETDFNENYVMPGLNLTSIMSGQYVSLILVGNIAHKTYRDTFFNTNTYHMDLSGNFSFTYKGFALGITGATVVESDNKSFYAIITIAREF